MRNVTKVELVQARRAQRPSKQSQKKKYISQMCENIFDDI